MDLDLSLLQAVVRTDKGYYLSKRAGISIKMMEGPAINGWTFIEDHVLEHGASPSESFFTAKTGIRFDDVGEESLEVLIKEIKSRFLWNRLKSVQAELTEDLEGKKPRQGLETIETFVKEVYKEGLSTGKTENLLALGGEILETYDAMKAGARGIPSPWDKMDEMTLGWWPGDFVVFVARMSVGKTFCLLMLARAAWLAGKRVLFVGTEMSRTKLAFRFFSIHLKLPYSEFKAGKLGFEQEERMRTSVKEMAKEEGLYVVGDEFDAKIEEIEAAVEEVNPDLIIVDGIYLVRNEGKNRHERVSNTADDLKRMARRKKKVVIASTQFNRTAATNSRSVIDPANVGISDVIGWNADVMWGMNQTDDMKEDQLMGFRPMKLREGSGDDFFVNWKFDEMDFSQAELDTDGDFQDGDYDKSLNDWGSGKSQDEDDDEEGLF